MVDKQINDFTEQTVSSGNEFAVVDDNGTIVKMKTSTIVEGKINDSTSAADKLYSSNKVQAHFDDVSIHAPIIDEDDMASDLATSVPSQQSVKAFVNGHTTDTNNPHSVTAAQVGLGNVPNIKHKTDATTAPTVSDDSTGNYSPGSIWVDINSDTAYICLDSTVGNAVWTQMNNASPTPVMWIELASYSDVTGTQASLDITSVINNSLYDQYLLVCDYLEPVTDGALMYLRTSIDNGVSWEAAANSYTLDGTHSQNGTHTDVGNVTAGAWDLGLGIGIGTNAPECWEGEIHLANLNRPGYEASMRFEANLYSVAGTRYRAWGGGRMYNNTTQKTAVQIKPSGGNLNYVVKVYGRKIGV